MYIKILFFNLFQAQDLRDLAEIQERKVVLFSIYTMTS